MNISIQSILNKLTKWRKQAEANQPVDPYADLSGDQRQYFKAWLARFHAENDCVYAALLERKHWTPFEWLRVPMVIQSMSDEEAGRLWNDFKDRN